MWVCLSVCLSVKSHLTYGTSVRPENAVTYSAGNEGQNFVGFSLKPMGCRDPALPPLYGHAYSRPFFLRKARMRIIVFTTWWTDAAISNQPERTRFPLVSHPSCREDGCEFRELPLIMPPSKVCLATPFNNARVAPYIIIWNSVSLVPRPL